MVLAFKENSRLFVSPVFLVRMNYYIVVRKASACAYGRLTPKAEDALTPHSFMPPLQPDRYHQA
jgi:hypothetical protein